MKITKEANCDVNVISGLNYKIGAMLQVLI